MLVDPFGTVYTDQGEPMSVAHQPDILREVLPGRLPRAGGLEWGGVRLDFGPADEPLDNLYELPIPEPEAAPMWPWLLGGGVGIALLLIFWSR